MKKLLFTFSALSLLLNSSVWAQQPTRLPTKLQGFQPVPFMMTIADAATGVRIFNDTDMSEIVQVVYKRGRFGTIKVVDNAIFCDANFGDDMHESSSICDVNPAEFLDIGISIYDYIEPAEGT